MRDYKGEIFMARWSFSRSGFLVLVEAERAIMDAIVSRVSPYLQGQEFCGKRPCGVWSIEARRTSVAGPRALCESERLRYDEPFVSMCPEERGIQVEEATEQ